MRISWFRCRSGEPPELPQRVRGRNLPAWMTEPTQAYPRPGRAGWLTPAQRWRANGGRW
ncbi:hypothetical protein ACN26Y_13165 [Micromonospora sp. WMMD558]|uniref:hypothetical protein n=1 Tax=unclassified Micromonospora TaxID=2617518 RepID=UPI0012B442EF|nr:hypothetical protein [Micromonospora sp. WMMC415]QGN47154.1 hypothetical protein GKC29_10030 [Micromonospora sp. WMMC415]